MRLITYVNQAPPPLLFPLNTALEGVSFEDYRAAHGINQSGLGHVLQSPAYFRWRQANPSADSLEMYLGRATHLLVLEPDEFRRRARVEEGLPDRGVKREGILAEARDKGDAVLLSQRHWDLLHEQQRAILENPVAARLLAKGVPETSLWWDEPNMVVRCKARFDWISHSSPTGPVLCDLKTAQTVGKDDFSRAISARRYDLQAYHYTRGASVSGCADGNTFAFIVVNKTPPIQCVVYWAGPSVFSHGFKWWEQAMEQYALALHSKSWPGVASESTIEMPRWARLPGQDEEEEADREDAEP